MSEALNLQPARSGFPASPTAIESDAKAARAAIGISHADERRIARELSPTIAWPTLALAIILPSTYAAIVVLAFSKILPLGLCAAVLGLVVYAHYTLVHEAIHGNVIAQPRSLAWVNTLVGWIGALAMGTGWPLLQRTHVLHHSHTNTERDPDIVVKGTFAQLLIKWLKNFPVALTPIFLLKYTNPPRYKRINGILSSSDITLASAVTVGALALLLTAIATGHFVEWLCLWFIPNRIASLILNIFFQWLPHYPFDRTDRYHNTRISLWIGGKIVLLQQNLHLMHHLWPSVPFYNYARLYRALRPLLEVENARIEGLSPGSHPHKWTMHH